MKNKPIHTIGIIANLKKPNAIREVNKLCKWLNGKGRKVIIPYTLAETARIQCEKSELSHLSRLCELIIVLGGDGTLLWGARMGVYGNKPVLGVNFGSLGFMVSTSFQELYQDLEKIIEGHYISEKRMMLEAVVHRNIQDADNSEEAEVVSSPIWNNSALNEAVITKDTLARMIHLQININGKYVTEYRADGLIISSPTGSTAHSLSAGGPIVYPTMDALIITPICPHTLSNRPLIVKGSDIVDVTILTPQQNTYLTLDGQEGLALQPEDTVRIQKANRTVQLINSPTRDYFQILHAKLKWGGN
jgi:NAD+ kinase